MELEQTGYSSLEVEFEFENKNQFAMAANYWESTQRRHWQFTRQELEDLRKKLEDEDQNLVQMYPLPHVRHLSIFINQRKCP